MFLYVVPKSFIEIILEFSSRCTQFIQIDLNQWELFNLDSRSSGAYFAHEVNIYWYSDGLYSGQSI